MNDRENTTKSFKTSCQTRKCWFACLLGFFFWFFIFSKFFFFKFSCLLFRFTHSKLKLQLTANLKKCKQIHSTKRRAMKDFFFARHLKCSRYLK